MLKIRHLGLVCFVFLILVTSTAMAQVDCTGAPQWEQPAIYDIGARVVFGLPASTAAVGSGFTTVQAVQNAVRYLTQRTEYAGRRYSWGSALPRSTPGFILPPAPQAENGSNYP